MGFVLTVAAAAFVLGILCGGAPGSLARRRLRGWPLVATALAIELVAGMLVRPDRVTYVLAQAGAAALAASFVALNLRVAGVALFGAGLGLNALVVGLNGAMPVSIAAARQAGAAIDGNTLAADPRHEQLDSATRLGWLGDVVPIASPLRREVLSVGDLAVGAGLAWYVWSGLRRSDEEETAACADHTVRSAIWP